jgi:hypothetical protein
MLGAVARENQSSSDGKLELMGYAYYEREGMKRGYSVRCKCHQRGCAEKIDRGLSYLCYSCLWYFCGKHLTVAQDPNDDDKLIEFDCFAGVSSQCCASCATRAQKEAA